MNKMTIKAACEELTSGPCAYVAFKHGATAAQLVERMQEACARFDFAEFVSDRPVRNGRKISKGLAFDYVEDGKSKTSELDTRGCSFFATTFDGFRLIVCDCGFSSFAYALI